MRKLVVALVLGLALVACANGQTTPSSNPNGAPVGTLDYIEVDGMPCIVRNDGHAGGITCDWRQWDGTYGETAR